MIILPSSSSYLLSLSTRKKIKYLYVVVAVNNKSDRKCNFLHQKAFNEHHAKKPQHFIFFILLCCFFGELFPSMREIFNCNQSGEITIYIFSSYIFFQPSYSWLCAALMKGNELVKGGEFDRARRDREKGGLSGSWTRNDVVLLVLLPPCALLVPLDISLQKLRRQGRRLETWKFSSSSRQREKTARYS